MLNRFPLHIQLGIVLASSIFTVTALSLILIKWADFWAVKHKLIHQTSALIPVLLPSSSAADDTRERSLQKIADILEYPVFIVDGGDFKMAAPEAIEVSGVPKLPLLSNQKIQVNQWTETHGGYATRTPDGRIFFIKTGAILLFHNEIGFIATLACVGIFVFFGSYPMIRHISFRLERLQKQIKRIGEGQLEARASVEGDDEVAILARHFNFTAQKIEDLVSRHKMILAHASHELRTPLARIRLALETLRELPNGGQLKVIEHNVSDLNQLIDELILLSRLDLGIASNNLVDVELMALLAELCASYPKVTLSGQNYIIKGDWFLLMRMFGNLLANAIKHGRAPVRIVVEEIGSCPSVVVYDCGEGIESDRYEQVFTPFYRGDNALDKLGYGLGLSIVQRAADQHQAVIQFEYAPCFGVRVLFKESVVYSKRQLN